MASWFTSWLPTLPSINLSLPSGVQKRFISFALKRFLGHLFKPGQLDIHQIDSQVGSGYVQVSDLALDNRAINELFSGLPVELQDGSIASVKARIPWPNPLTSTVGFSLDSLHLVLRVLPASKHPTPQSQNLSESVASMAESFIHDELTPREEAALRDSLNPNMASSVYSMDEEMSVPGGLDPFISAPELDEESFSDVDPAGVSIFATLIERLLARFEFDATNTKITLIHPEHSTFTLSIDEVRYHTETRMSEATSTTSEESGEVRTVSISGINLFASSLRPSTNTSSPLSPLTPVTVSQTPADSPSSSRLISSLSQHTPRPVSPASSSSSLDEDTQFAMSQSLAFLPPRPTSPTSSVASSMYQSAIGGDPDPQDDSTAQRDGSPSPGPRERSMATEQWADSEATSSIQDETILSFGPNPILIRLSTPAVRENTDERSPVPSPKEPENLRLSVSFGLIACAFRAWHFRAITDLIETLSSHTPLQSTSPQDPTPSPDQAQLGIDVSVKLRGLICLILTPSYSEVMTNTVDAVLSDFFSRPLSPPQISLSYLRLHLDNISASASSTFVGPSRNRTGPRTNEDAHTSITSSLSIAELSLFSFRNTSSDATRQLASPILFTDHHLPSQYPSAHAHPHPPTSAQPHPKLPTFPITDWTDEKLQHLNGPRLSLWRSKLSQRHGGKSERRTSTIRDPTSEESHPSSITISFKRISQLNKKGMLSVVDDVEMNVVPLHLCVDLDRLLGDGSLLAFLDEILGAARSGSDHGEMEYEEIDDDEAEGDTPPATPRVATLRELERAREKERRRLERLVLEDLNLDIDYRTPEKTIPINAQRSSTKQGARKRNPKPKPNGKKLNITVSLPMIRLQVRCPSPKGSPPRSGSFVFDIHDTRLTNWAPPSPPGARFGPSDSPGSRVIDAAEDSLLLSAECRRIIVASSLVGENKASSLISVGSLRPADFLHESYHDFGTDQRPLLQPRIAVTKSKSLPQSTRPSFTILALSVWIPSVHVNVSKTIVDGLQYWADDLSQFMERISGSNPRDSDTERADSRDTSIIGSRYFAKSRTGSTSGSGMSTRSGEARSETVIKVLLSEAAVRVELPRLSEGSSSARPFDIFASDVDVLVENKPDGKEETVFTVAVLDVTVKNATTPSTYETYLSLTAPRSLMSAPKPLVKLQFTSLIVPETTAKESRVKLSLWGFTCNFFPYVDWVSDLVLFAKAPPGAFESVIPSERTAVSLKIMDGSIRAVAPSHPGAVVLHIGDLSFSTNIVGSSADVAFQLSTPALAVLALDDLSSVNEVNHSSSGVNFWKKSGFALLAEVADLDLNFQKIVEEQNRIRVVVERVGLRLHLCADTLASVMAFSNDLASAFRSPVDDLAPKPPRRPTMISETISQHQGLMSSVDDLAFKRVPDVGPAPDMMFDDLPTNPDYLDEVNAAGLRELRDDDLEDFDLEDATADRFTATSATHQTGVVSKVGGETIKILRPEGIQIVENYFDTLTPDTANITSELGATALRVLVHNADINLFLYDGYDWVKTRRMIEDEIKEMRKRLAKIRQLVASGQTQDPSLEETSALLFNSVYIGLNQDADQFEPGALIAAIDEELREDLDTISESSWQSLQPPTTGKPRERSPRIHGKRLTRSRTPSIEFRIAGLDAEVDQYLPNEAMVSRTFATIKELEILDHIKTSTWKKFLTDSRSDSRGNIRETDSNMVRVELRSIRPVPGHPSEEARLRAKILPLRLHVDQDALDFLKKFFSFKDPHATPPPVDTNDNDIYFQLAEIFPVELKLDYKPRRVDYRALREGKTMELMNFFHFDGAEMTLRHITLTGITGWPRLFDLLNDLWTPDVKATQLVEVISGVAPIRSVINVGSGFADLVLLPIAQYKKDGRIVRGVQKGTTAFVRSTALEAIKLGARLATGTQVILEQAEGVLGSQFKNPVTAETLTVPSLGEDFIPPGFEGSDEDDEADDLISRYAEQPVDIKEGMQSAYKSLSRNLNSAAQTILAVPMEVYERSGNEGAVRSVIRAVPIAVLKPMIGASEAVSKTLLGLHNTLDPNVRLDNEEKYKHR